MEQPKVLGRIFGTSLLCGFCVCFVMGFLFNLAWHLAVLGFWGSLALVAGCAGILVLCRRRLRAFPKRKG